MYTEYSLGYRRDLIQDGGLGTGPTPQFLPGVNIRDVLQGSGQPTVAHQLHYTSSKDAPDGIGATIPLPDIVDAQIIYEQVSSNLNDV
ncbi:uncharacterized [Tachysurus ichikawai]